MAEINRQVRLCGFGGQGVILAGAILGYAGINDKKWVASSSSYGSAARGGSCRSDVIISDEPIRFPHVIAADILIAMSQKAYDVYLENMKPEGGIVVYEKQLVVAKERSGLKQVGVAATNAAIKELDSRQVANIIILAAAVAITGIVGQDALKTALTENIPERFRALNLKAVELGFRLGSAATSKEMGRKG